MKKILSVILSLLITIQLAIIIPALASSQSGEAAGALLINDFSEYSLVTSKAEQMISETLLIGRAHGLLRMTLRQRAGNISAFPTVKKLPIIHPDLRSSQTLPAAQPPRAAGSLPQIQNIG